MNILNEYLASASQKKIIALAERVEELERELHECKDDHDRELQATIVHHQRQHDEVVSVLKEYQNAIGQLFESVESLLIDTRNLRKLSRG
jgi:LytS/YehU family sensor histidine kinase